jgi:hypothetical protein
VLWRLTLRSFRDGLRYLSNFYCLPGRAGGSPNGLGIVLTSLTLLTRRKRFWQLGGLAGLVGLAIAASGFWAK